MGFGEARERLNPQKSRQGRQSLRVKNVRTCPNVFKGKPLKRLSIFVRDFVRKLKFSDKILRHAVQKQQKWETSIPSPVSFHSLSWKEKWENVVSDKILSEFVRKTSDFVRKLISRTKFFVKSSRSTLKCQMNRWCIKFLSEKCPFNLALRKIV